MNWRESKMRLTELEQALEGDVEFADAAMASLREEDPLSTYTPSTSGMALINHWLGERILNCYERGRVVDDTRAGTVFADENGDYSKAVFAIDHDRFVDVNELRLLCFKWDLPIPHKLREAETPQVLTDDQPNEIGYTIRGAAIALAQKYSLPEDAIRQSIFDAAVQEKLTVRNPRTGLPYIPEKRRDFYERVSIEDLNIWLEQSGVDYRLGDGNSDALRTGTPLKKNVLLKQLREYPELANAMQANDPEFVDCRVPPESAPGKKNGYYYLEKVERVCASRWGRKTNLPTTPSLTSPQPRAVRGMKDGKKFG